MVQGLAYLFAKKGYKNKCNSSWCYNFRYDRSTTDGNLYHPRNMLGRVYMPEEVAETACFLMSDLSGCISGQIIICNNTKSINVRWK